MSLRRNQDLVVRADALLQAARQEKADLARGWAVIETSLERRSSDWAQIEVAVGALNLIGRRLVVAVTLIVALTVMLDVAHGAPLWGSVVSWPGFWRSSSPWSEIWLSPASAS